MNLFSISRRNMRQRSLSTILTMLLVAVGVGLVSMILIIQVEVREGFQGVAGRFDLVVGPKGSPLQLVLNTVFHMDKPVGNMRWKDYEEIRDLVYTREAIPVVTGDTFEGFHLVGTTSSFLTKLEVRKGRGFEFVEGGPFKEHVHEEHDDEDFEAVFGSEAARRTGLKVGDTFLATHGFAKKGVSKHDQHNYRVVGVLKPTGTPHDRAVYCHLDTFFDLHDSERAQQKMLSGVLVLTEASSFTSQLYDKINFEMKGNLMAVYPTSAIKDLMTFIGGIQRVLVGISLLVLLAAGVSILVAIYNSMNERRREIAIIRALGSPAGTVFGIVVIEAATICLVGAFAGLILSRIGILLGGGVLNEVTGLLIGFPVPGLTDLYLVVGAVVIGILSSIIPAVAAYRTDIATNIRPVT